MYIYVYVYVYVIYTCVDIYIYMLTVRLCGQWLLHPVPGFPTTSRSGRRSWQAARRGSLLGSSDPGVTDSWTIADHSGPRNSGAKSSRTIQIHQLSSLDVR